MGIFIFNRRLMKAFFTAALMTAAISGRGLFKFDDLDAARRLEGKDDTCEVDKKELKDETKTLKNKICGLEDWDSKFCKFCKTEPADDAKEKALWLENSLKMYKESLKIEKKLRDEVVDLRNRLEWNRLRRVEHEWSRQARYTSEEEIMVETRKWAAAKAGAYKWGCDDCCSK